MRLPTPLRADRRCLFPPARFGRTTERTISWRGSVCWLHIICIQRGVCGKYITGLDRDPGWLDGIRSLLYCHHYLSRRGCGPRARVQRQKSRRLGTTQTGFWEIVNTRTVPTHVMVRDSLAFSDNSWRTFNLYTCFLSLTIAMGDSLATFSEKSGDVPKGIFPQARPQKSLPTRWKRSGAAVFARCWQWANTQQLCCLLLCCCFHFFFFYSALQLAYFF